MSVIEDAVKVYRNAMVHALVPPQMRPTFSQEAYADLTLTETEDVTDPRVKIAADGMVETRVVPGTSDFIRGTQPGSVSRVRNAHTYQRYSKVITLTATNGTKLDSSTTFSQDGIDVGVCDLLIFNGSLRVGSSLLFSIDRPVNQILVDNNSLFIPFADVIMSNAGGVSTPVVPFLLSIPRGHHRVYVGLYATQPNQVAPFSDVANFVAINTGRA